MDHMDWVVAVAVVAVGQGVVLEVADNKRMD